MSKIRKSLEENKDAILAAVPKELHPEVEAALANVEESPVLKGDDAVAAVKAELKANPTIDESACADSLKSIAAPEPAPAPTDAEVAALQAELLEAAEGLGPHSDSE